MNFRSHTVRVFVVLLAVLAAVPTFAAGKRRAISPLPEITLRGVVTDVENGNPVVFADVVNGDQRTTTDAQGKFEILIPAGRQTSLIVSRSGYDTAIQNLAAGANDVAVQLRGRPGVRVRTTDNRNLQLDLETAQFAYLVPFSGYARSDTGKFCLPDGSQSRPDKSTIARVIGPATPGEFRNCCTIGPTMKARIELKNGQQTDVYFVDACFGYEVDFVGRDHTTGEFVFLKWTEIAEVVFP